MCQNYVKLVCLLFVIIFSACHSEETPLPSCRFVEVTQEETRICIKIHSSLPEVAICREDGRCLTVLAHYYSCVSLAYDPGEVLYVHHGDEVCTIATY